MPRPTESELALANLEKYAKNYTPGRALMSTPVVETYELWHSVSVLINEIFSLQEKVKRLEDGGCEHE